MKNRVITGAFLLLAASGNAQLKQEDQTMRTVIHRAETRGHANHGWLDTHHTFSFANYYNPDRMQFGALRVLNDDWVDGGRGFGTHPHDNMEIVSIPLVGDLEHKDSMGHTQVIRQGDVQVMSAGTGVFHSEYNKNPDEKVNFLQIWVFPEKRDIAPRYDQKAFAPEDRINRWQRIVSPTEEEAVWINQNAFFTLGKPQAGKTLSYDRQSEGNGVYVFVISGSIRIGDTTLNKRDGMGLYSFESLDVQALADSEVLLIEVPVQAKS